VRHLQIHQLRQLQKQQPNRSLKFSTDTTDQQTNKQTHTHTTKDFFYQFFDFRYKSLHRQNFEKSFDSSEWRPQQLQLITTSSSSNSNNELHHYSQIKAKWLCYFTNWTNLENIHKSCEAFCEIYKKQTQQLVFGIILKSQQTTHYHTDTGTNSINYYHIPYR